MPRYMLDADTCSHVMKPSNDALLKRLRETPVSEVCISVITKAAPVRCRSVSVAAAG